MILVKYEKITKKKKQEDIKYGICSYIFCFCFFPFFMCISYFVFTCVCSTLLMLLIRWGKEED